MSMQTASVPYQSQFVEGAFKRDTDGHFNSTVANSLVKLGINPLREIIAGAKVFLELGLTESDLAGNRARIEALGLTLVQPSDIAA